MRSFRKLRPQGPVLSGVIGVLSLVLLVVTAVAIPQIRFQFSTTGYTAEFDNAAGLGVGDQVHVAGVPAGEITDVQLVDDHVRVAFRLDRDQPLGESTGAAVKLATALGNRYLAVEPAGSEELADRVIPRDRTSIPYSLDDIAEGAQQTSERLDVDQLREMLGTLRDAAPEGAELGAALDGVGRAADIVEERNEQFQGLLEGAQTLTTALVGQQDMLGTLFGDAELVADTLDSRSETIRQLIADLDAITTTVDGLVQENEPRFAPLLSDLHTITDTLADHDAQIVDLLEKLGPSSRYLANATGNGPWGDVSGPAGPLPDNLLCVVELVEGCR